MSARGGAVPGLRARGRAEAVLPGTPAGAGPETARLRHMNRARLAARPARAARPPPLARVRRYKRPGARSSSIASLGPHTAQAVGPQHIQGPPGTRGSSRQPQVGPRASSGVHQLRQNVCLHAFCASWCQPAERWRGGSITSIPPSTPAGRCRRPPEEHENSTQGRLVGVRGGRGPGVASARAHRVGHAAPGRTPDRVRECHRPRHHEQPCPDPCRICSP
jgi:hypothetical protein